MLINHQGYLILMIWKYVFFYFLKYLKDILTKVYKFTYVKLISYNDLIIFSVCVYYCETVQVVTLK